VLGFVGLGLGQAAWLLPASQHLVGWSDGRPGRVALLAPPLWLPVTLVAGLAAVAAVAVAWRRGGRPLGQLVRLTAPLLLLWLWGLPYFPWLATELPLLIALSGPARWLVGGLAAVGVLLAGLELGIWRRPVWGWPGRRFVAVVSLLVFVGAGHWMKRVQGFGGDEPHYLVIAHSLLADRDLRIENNHENRDYWAFHPAELPMHYLNRGRDGVIYSIHGPGLPALLAPAYAVAGHWGALALVGVMAALAAVAIFDVAAVVASPPIALATWAGVALTVPFGLQAWLLFPEMPAALLLAWTVSWIWRPPPDRPPAWIWRGAVLSLLPWLHMKFSLLLLVAGLWLALRLWPRWRLVVALLAPIGVSGLLWLGAFWVMYGDINPTVAYGYSAGAELDWLNVPRGLLGLAFDQEYGLLPYSPIFAVAALGAWTMARRPELRGYLGGSLLVMAPFLVSTTQYYMWWGGSSVPARFVVPILPLLAPMIAVAIREHRGAAARGAIGLTLAYSVLAFVAVMARPAAMLMYNDRDGTGRLVETMQAGAPLTASLPSFIDPEILVQLPATLVWVVAALVAAAAAWLVSRRVRAGPFWSGVAALLVFAASGSVLAAGALPDDAVRGTASAGRQRLLNTYPGPSLKAYAYDRGVWLDEPALFERASIEYRFAPGTVDDPARLTPPFDLPPGRYDVLVWFRARQTEPGEMFVSYDGVHGTLVTADGRTTNPAVVPLELPVGLGGLRLGATTAALASSVTGAAIVPRAVVPREERESPGRVRSVIPLGDRPGRYAFTLDLFTFVDPGTRWVEGGRTTDWLVAPGDAAWVRVSVRNGGVDNRIHVTAGGVEEVFELAAWETAELRVPVPPETNGIPLRIHPETGFVPAEVEPGSTDRRRLGCTVAVTLE